MQFIADLHIHSRHSRATSRDMDIENLDKWAKIKGIKVMGTGDFTHPQWLKELREKLDPVEPGLFKHKYQSCSPLLNSDWLPDNGSIQTDVGTRFLLSSEISCIYSRENQTKKIHVIVLAPDFKTVEKINARLGWIGNLKSDGRPILGLDVKELAKIVLGMSEDCMIIPAHMWTPWFSLLGSMSGFNSLRECFEEVSPYIYAGETGLSSDPEMNWRFSALDNLALISNSDAHSPSKIGREANVFDTDLSYKGITGAIKDKNPEKFLETIEFFPEEGKYHYDGHRDCKVCLDPKKTKELNEICPECGNPVTVGVLHRVDDLSDRENGEKPSKTIPFRKLIPLEEIIADVRDVGVNSKTVRKEYKDLIKHFGSEFNVLLNASFDQLESACSLDLAEGIRRVRQGEVNIHPGHDGEYGKIEIFKEEEKGNFTRQAGLF
jgi:uncharacterized protein (TIGR00375 family)